MPKRRAPIRNGRRKVVLDRLFGSLLSSSASKDNEGTRQMSSSHSYSLRPSRKEKTSLVKLMNEFQSTPVDKGYTARPNTMLEISRLSNIQADCEIDEIVASAKVKKEILRLRQQVGYNGVNSPIGVSPKLSPVKHSCSFAKLLPPGSVGRTLPTKLDSFPSILEQHTAELSKVQSTNGGKIMQKMKNLHIINSQAPLNFTNREEYMLRSRMSLQTTKPKKTTLSMVSLEVSKSRLSRSDPEAASFEKILNICHQPNLIPWEMLFTTEYCPNCRLSFATFTLRQLSLSEKIGEGSFAEIFSIHNAQHCVCIKVMPVGGSVCVNDEPQRSFGEVLPEVLISTELSRVRQGGDGWSSPNLLKLISIHCVVGPYPEQLLIAWDKYAEHFESFNERPDMFDDSQIFVVLLMEHGGLDMERFRLKSVKQAESALKQVIATLSILETKFQFEHRDLHIGNILIKKTDADQLDYTMDNANFQLSSDGIVIYIIDFTLSRLQQNEYIIFNDLSTDQQLFEGQGDPQYDVYRKMRQLNENNWMQYFPKTNLMWLNHVVSQLALVKYNGRSLSMVQKNRLRRFQQLMQRTISTKLKRALEILYLNKIVGWNGRQNEVIVARRPSDPKTRPFLVVFFAGDIQDTSEAMMQRSNCKAYAPWCLENVLEMLATKFPASLVMTVKASKISNDSFACYSNFVPSDEVYGVPTFCDDYGAWMHLQCLIENAISSVDPELDLPDSVALVGFSKGCVVLNQLIWEMGMAVENKLNLLKKIRSIYWLDGGHAGRTSTWLCDERKLQTLAKNMGFVTVQIDVTPYQIRDTRRPWIGKQEAQFVRLLQQYGVKVMVYEHFSEEPPSLETHFKVLDAFQPQY